MPWSIKPHPILMNCPQANRLKRSKLYQNYQCSFNVRRLWRFGNFCCNFFTISGQIRGEYVKILAIWAKLLQYIFVRSKSLCCPVISYLFQVYTVSVIRNWFSQPVTFVDPKQAQKFECPITLAPLYHPVSISGSDPKHVFSEPIIDELTKTSKQDPLDATPLDAEWKVTERALDKEISGAIVKCPYSFLGN